jgi:hypothetical protein
MKNKEINKIIDDICKAIIIIGILLIIILMIKERSSKQSQTVTTCNSLHRVNLSPQKDCWQDLINAIAFVESTNNPKAKNGQSVGLLQITPIYVAECNRILGENKYTLADREDSVKSIEMFKIYTQYHSNVQNIEKTIHVHNPRGGQKYINKVLNQMSVK